MKIALVSTAAAAALVTALPLPVWAARLTPTDLDSLRLGARIVGPVGPEVETTFVNRQGEGIGDLISSVSCPAGFTACVPPNNPSGTVYTYIHTVTPGVDLPNDAPFPSPATIVPLDDARTFRLNFEAAGFNGVAGYSFGEAAAALGSRNLPIVRQTNSNRLIWRVPSQAEWNQGESISFFWQTTQNPSGPGGSYGLIAPGERGSANGPLPTPVPFGGSQVPEPGAIAPLALLGVGLLWTSRHHASSLRK